MNTAEFKRVLARSGLVIGIVLLGGCHPLRALRGDGSCKKPGLYGEAQTVPPLKIPPGLQAPDTAQALRVPDLNQPAPPPRSKNDPCLDAPPSYSVPKPAPQPAA